MGRISLNWRPKATWFFQGNQAGNLLQVGREAAPHQTPLFFSHNDWPEQIMDALLQVIEGRLSCGNDVEICNVVLIFQSLHPCFSMRIIEQD